MRLSRTPSAEGWTVTPLVASGLKVGRLQVEAGASHQLQNGDEIWAGNNLLQLLAHGKNITKTAVMPELSDVELIMNEALLDYEDRRRDLFDGDERQRQELLSAELDRLIEEELDIQGQPDLIPTVNRYCREALRPAFDIGLSDERCPRRHR